MSDLDEPLRGSGKLTALARAKGLYTFTQLLSFVQALPYGRNANRNDFSLVLSKGRGTCSSKHALVKLLADENQIPAKLMLVIYKMNPENTPGIGRILTDANLKYIPEAHCFLHMGDADLDLTSPLSDIHALKRHFMHQEEIEPDQVITYKVQLHQQYLRTWLQSQALDLKFHALWAMREKCIDQISKSPQGAGR